MCIITARMRRVVISTMFCNFTANFLLLICFLAAGTATNFGIKNRFDNYIIGGQLAGKGEYPFQVSLQIGTAEVFIHVCGASIIDQSWLLTAAHCCRAIDERYTRVKAGTVDLSEEGIIRYISQIIIHPEYNADISDNDVALIQVNEPFVFSDVVKPIRLTDTTPIAGGMAIVSGWGLLNHNDIVTPDNLYYVMVVIMEHDDCKKIYNSINFTDNMLCAGDPNGGKDACQGDSGGALTASDNYLVGVVSWGKGCGEKGFPGVYADVARIRNWAMLTMGSN